MASGFDLYRIYVVEAEKNRFLDLLAGIRPNESKIWHITPGYQLSQFNVVLTDEELCFIKVSVPLLRCAWLQEWTTNDKFN